MISHEVLFFLSIFYFFYFSTFSIFSPSSNECRNGEIERVQSIMSKWGDLFMVTENHSVFCLHKVDLQKKLNTFYEEHLYSLALKVASANNLYYNSIADIHKK